MDANATIIIALVALVPAIFGASRLNRRATERFFENNQRSTEKLSEQFEKRFDAKFDTVLAEIRRLNNRSDNIEKRLDRVERQLESIFNPVLPK